MKSFFLIGLTVLITSISTGQSLYQNKLVKLTMESPPGWKYAGTEDSKKNLKELKFTEEQLKRITASSNGVISQISYYKYSIDSVSGFIPTIKITVRLNPASNFDEFKHLMSASAERLKTTLDSLEYLDHLKPVKLSNHNGIYYAVRYLLTPAAAAKVTVRVKSYSIPRGRYLVSITLMDNEKAEDCSGLFTEVIKSITITD